MYDFEIQNMMKEYNYIIPKILQFVVSFLNFDAAAALIFLAVIYWSAD